MKILLISTYFYPDTSIASQRITAFARYFAELGAKTIVLTTRKLANTSLVKDEKLEDVVAIHELNYFHPSFLFRKKGSKSSEVGEEIPAEKRLTIYDHVAKFGKRILYSQTGRIPDRGFTDFWILQAYRTGIRLVEEHGITHILSSYAPPASHLVAGLLKQKYSDVIWVADYRDLWIEHPVHRGLFPFRWFERHLEKKFLIKANLVTTVSPPLAGVLRDKSERPVEVIWNGFVEQPHVFDPSISPRRSGPLRIVYAGTLYPPYRDPGTFFEALRNLREKGYIKGNEIIVDFVGWDQDYVVKQIVGMRLEGLVRLKGSVSHQESLRLQAEADVILFLDWLEPGNRGIVTGKIFENLAFGKPILFLTKEGTIAKSLAEKAGLALVATCSDECEVHLQRLLEGSVQIHPQWDFIEQFQRKRQIEKLYNLMMQMDKSI